MSPQGAHAEKEGQVSRSQVTPGGQVENSRSQISCLFVMFSMKVNKIKLFELCHSEHSYLFKNVHLNLYYFIIILIKCPFNV